MKKKSVLCFCLLSGAIHLCAQPDSLEHATDRGWHLERHEVVIAARSADEPGLQRNQLDSVTLAHYSGASLADLLGSGGIFLKNYGNGSLATTALHGASASQTAILWNGVDLRSTTNGVVDLSIVPVFLFDDVAVLNGSSVNAIGGAVELTSNVQADSGFHIRYVSQWGSFGEMQNGIRINETKRNTSFGIRLYQQHADNNFTFINSAMAGNPEDTMQHAEFGAKGIMTSLAWNSANSQAKKSDHMVRLDAWYNYSFRELPATMLEAGSASTQLDEFARAVFRYDGICPWFDMKFTSALLTEFMDFELGYGWPSSLTHSTVLDHSLLITRSFRNWNAGIGAKQRHTIAGVSQYLPVTAQDRMEWHADIHQRFGKKLIAGIFLHDEYLGNIPQPLTGSAGMNYFPDSILTLRISVSRNYRLPTFNDLYWFPGGNPLLKPEDSRNLDVSAELNFGKRKWRLGYTIAGYYRYTYNWIQWQPGPGYWVPKNLYEVKSYGADHFINVSWHSGKWKFRWNGALHYVRAVNARSALSADSSIGKQLMYLPAYTWNTAFRFYYSNCYFECAGQFTGLRFTTVDHSSWLSSYTIGSVTMGYRTNRSFGYIDIFLRCDNITDEMYQSVAWRPMPGRNFHLGIQLAADKIQRK